MTPGEVFERHRDLARRVAGSYLRKLPSHIQAREVEVAALVGLWDAARRHATLPDEEFRRLAALRIRGAIADEYRELDAFPRGTRRGHGEFFRMIYIDSIEQVDAFREYAVYPQIELFLDQQRELAWLWRATRRLPKQQRSVLRRILRGERQKEIGDSIGLTQARISQVVSEAVATLRKKRAREAHQRTQRSQRA